MNLSAHILALVCIVIVTVDAYLQSAVSIARPFGSISLVQRPATVYFSEDEYCALDDDCEDNGSKHSPFLQSPDVLARLARLAAAFGPHKLALKQIEHVEVASYDTKHLELMAVVCEEECLTLLIPVSLPTPCATNDEEECFIDNIEELDSTATAQIHQWEWEETHHEDVAARQRQIEELKVTDSFPDWWQKAGPMSRDCSSLQRLLNEPDFHQEIKALVVHNLATDSKYDMFEVDQVGVAAVGPAGLIIKASAHELKILAATDDDADAPSGVIVQVPIAFPNPASTIESLQNAVLGAVAVAGDFMDN